jgi:hypothetical protein
MIYFGVRMCLVPRADQPNGGGQDFSFQFLKPLLVSRSKTDFLLID